MSLAVLTRDAELRGDPTGTTATRQRWEGEMRKRFRRLQTLIQEAVVRRDVLGIGTDSLADFATVSVMARAVADAEAPPSGAYQFKRRDEKVKAFMAWLRAAEHELILETLPGTPIQTSAATAWQNKYIDSAYRKGLRDAGEALERAGSEFEAGSVRAAFNRPVHANRAGLIYTRAFSALAGVTEEMDRQISSVLAQALIDGRNPLDTARRLNDRVSRIGITRARVIARTETIAAHAEATLNLFEEAGVEQVTVSAEWATASDDRVCPECAAMEGRVFNVSESHGMIPLHPNCRCAFLPVVED